MASLALAQPLTSTRVSAACSGSVGWRGATPGSCRHLYTSSWQAGYCWRLASTRVHRQTYMRLYPILLVKQDGSTIHIRCEPRRMLKVSFLPDTPRIGLEDPEACRNYSSGLVA